MTQNTNSKPIDAHPIALHIGFSGSRQLFPPHLVDEALASVRASVIQQLVEKFGALRAELSLHSGYFFVGISQLAVGADSVFSDACAQAGIPLRVFLPQTRDEYLAGRGSKGADFNAQERLDAEARFEHPNVIQERVVSQARDRQTRFRECSFEILRLADVVITLKSDFAATGRAGGTDDFTEATKRHGKALFALTLKVNSNADLQVDCESIIPKKLDLPTLPDTLRRVSLLRNGFTNQVKKQASHVSGALKLAFEKHMRVVIWTHVMATALAAAAVAISYAVKGADGPLAYWLYSAVPWLLAIEVCALVWGFYTHRHLHHDSTTHRWAESRLIAEIARSTQTLGAGTDIVNKEERIFAGQHSYLKHVFDLPLPSEFRALTRTLNALHLQATRPNRTAHWTGLRDRYVRERFDTTETKNRGQIPYFSAELLLAETAVKRANRWFYIYASLAIIATVAKLLLPYFGIQISGIAAVLSWLAIVMPVLAVAVMSITANLDKDARVSTYKVMLGFLIAQRQRVVDAGTEPKFLRLQAETEGKILGEAVNWYFRRRFINPA